MKSRFLLVAFIGLMACSTNKVAVNNEEYSTEHVTSVKSFGPRGRIIYPEDVPNLQRTEVETEEVHFASEEKADSEPLKTDKKSVNVVNASDKTAKSSVYKSENAAKANRSDAKPDWEPYRDKPETNSSKKNNGFAIAGFVLSLFFYFFPLAIIFSAIGLNSEKRGLAIAGLVLGCVSAALVIALLIYALIFA